MEEYCQICNNETYLIGTLGNLNHFNCRYCGWNQHALTESNEYEKEETCSK